MANTNWRYKSLEDGPHEWRRAIHLGWIDGQHRARWHPDYDRMNRAEQIGYESGRLHAANIIASGLPVPKWDGGRAGASDFWDRIVEVVQVAGNPIPPEFEEAA
jgi:hypothetical protein